MLVNEKKIIVCSDLFLYKYLCSKFGTYIGHLNTILALGGEGGEGFGQTNYLPKVKC